MGRSTFEGPVLAGGNRFGPLRNIGSVELVQDATINLANTTANTAGYGGGSGVFINSNNIPNSNATLYTPSSNSLPVATTPTADTATNIYRGYIAYLPAGSTINDILIDIGVVFASTGTITSTTFYVSNNITAAAGTPTYAATAVLTSPAVGRQSLATLTATQLANWQATSTDIVQAGADNLSQVVFTVAVVGTSLSAVTAGTFYFTIRYTQPDGNIGTTTAYPYGNLD